MDKNTAWFNTIRSKNEYQISAEQQGRYTAYHSLSANGFSPDNRAGDFAQAITVPDRYPGKRSYFHVLDEQGRHFVTAPRDLGLQSVQNFRELGGYPTADGRSVKWGQFYRSARLVALSKEERARFEQLGIRVVLDLRSDIEIQQHPDPVFQGVEQKEISAIIELEAKEINFDPAALYHLTPQEMQKDDEAFTGRYRNMPFDNKAYRYLFEKLASQQVPVLFHCTAGKDRTGVAAMLILLALGVPWQVIQQDYLLTNRYFERQVQKTLANYYQPHHPEHVRRFLMSIEGVQPHNLQASYDEILRRYGDTNQYFASEYGLTQTDLAWLRAQYLEEQKV